MTLYKGDPEIENSDIVGQVLEFYYGIALNKKQNICWVCPQKDVHDIAMYEFQEDLQKPQWVKVNDFYPKNPHELLQLKCSLDEKIIIGTTLRGFVLWDTELIHSTQGESGFTDLKLPTSTRNIQTKMNKSTSCVLSAKNVYAIAGMKPKPNFLEQFFITKCFYSNSYIIITIQTFLLGFPQSQARKVQSYADVIMDSP